MTVEQHIAAVGSAQLELPQRPISSHSVLIHECRLPRVDRMFYVENSPAPQRFFMADCGLPSKCLHRNLTVALKVKAQRGWSADARS